jgi:hypothetical protein
MKRSLSVPEQHQRKIALDTLRLSEVGAHIMGGMDHREAVRLLRDFGYSDTDIRIRLEAAGHDHTKFMS